MSAESAISQSIKNDSIKLSLPVFDSMVMESEYCDSLKTAYFKVNKELASLIFDNNKMFRDFENEREKKIKLQSQLEIKEKEFKKLFQIPNKGWFVPLLIGLAAGILLGSSL